MNCRRRMSSPSISRTPAGPSKAGNGVSKTDGMRLVDRQQMQAPPADAQGKVIEDK